MKAPAARRRPGASFRCRKRDRDDAAINEMEEISWNVTTQVLQTYGLSEKTHQVRFPYRPNHELADKLPRTERIFSMKCFMTNQQCIVESEFGHMKDGSGERELFMISPFEYPYDDLYDSITTSFQSTGWTVARADRAVQLGFVMCERICKKIRHAKYVLVDITEDNPNVHYELGLSFGFGKQVAFLAGDEEANDSRARKDWGTFVKERGKKVLTYSEVQSTPDLGALIKSVAVDTNRLTATIRNPASYIGMPDSGAQANKKALFCLSTPLADWQMLSQRAREILENLGWTLQLDDIRSGFKVEDILDRLRLCKICMIDASHYGNRANLSTYWVLGLAHALGRDTIPVRNSARSGDSTPFDVRGLYQIYFNKLKDFETGLKDILNEIDRHYNAEVKEYPQRYVWDRILSHKHEVEIFTFGRPAEIDPRREGGRTNVDTWDYQAVGMLVSFLAKKYKEATVKILPPAFERAGRTEEEIKDRARTVAQELARERNYIIVGSPDVSDYAEVVLAKAYDIPPYTTLRCSEEQCKGGLCHVRCVGRAGYLFYKKKLFLNGSATGKNSAEAVDGTGAGNDLSHPRSTSFCYRDAPGEQQYVLWYGQPYQCSAQVTYGVITILYENPFALPGDEPAPSSVIVLSGFSGVATYGLAVLLSGGKGEASANPRPESAKQAGEEPATILRTELRKQAAAQAVQILVRIEFDTAPREFRRDGRRWRSIAVVDVRPLQKTVVEDDGRAAAMPSR
jgi:hypothetical protein